MEEIRRGEGRMEGGREGGRAGEERVWGIWY